MTVHVDQDDGESVPDETLVLAGPAGSYLVGAVARARRRARADRNGPTREYVAAELAKLGFSPPEPDATVSIDLASETARVLIDRVRQPKASP